MSAAITQSSVNHVSLGDLSATVQHAVRAFLGGRHIPTELSVAAAHYEGLIDRIEGAGWSFDKLNQVRHAFDATARSLMSDLEDSYPDMSEAEQRSFLAPFLTALHQFAELTQKEREALRAEYERFTQLRAETLQEFAVEQDV